MILQHTWQMVLSEEKTVTRRLVKDGEYGVNDFGEKIFSDGSNGMIDAVYTTSGYRKWMVNNTYAVQPGRGLHSVGRDKMGAYWHSVGNCEWKTMDTAASGKPLGHVMCTHPWSFLMPVRIRITAIGREWLQDITEDGARAEGFESPAHFIQKFREINKIAPLDSEVWALSFVLDGQ